jgi:cell fate regulator YaaT (PSP1 superfamily)
MPVAVGVAFKRVAKSYWFDPGAHSLEDFDRVVVETARGLEIGTVRVTARQVPDGELQAPLKRVVRKANERDLDQETRNRQRAKEALALGRERAKSHGLAMRVLQSEYSFDGSMVTIYFTSENRVDFREMVKDISAKLRCRVQLHQVGARDQAKMIGGVGPCGLTLCCSTFLTEFAPISMKMARDQSLFLNPVKFSGICGKLMCCLRYEHDSYVDAKKRLPETGDLVRTPKGQGRVVSVNLIKGEVSVVHGEGEAPVAFPAAEVAKERTEKCSSCHGCSAGEMKKDFEDASYGDAEPEELDLRDIDG